MQGSCAREHRFISIEPVTPPNVDYFVAAPESGDGGKMSRDCCFKCAPRTPKQTVQ
jgi:hypothetical protein